MNSDVLAQYTVETTLPDLVIVQRSSDGDVLQGVAMKTETPYSDWSGLFCLNEITEKWVLENQCSGLQSF
jgi:hypothetical protein